MRSLAGASIALATWSLIVTGAVAEDGPSGGGISMPWDTPVAPPPAPDAAEEQDTPTPPAEPAREPGSRLEAQAPWWSPAPAQLAYAADTGLPVALRNGQGQRLALIPPGRFRMGSPEEEEGRDHDEGPVHAVRIAAGLYVGATEVTNDEYHRFLAASAYDGQPDADEYYLMHQRKEMRVPAAPDYPIVYVSWKNALAYCRWLTETEVRAGRVPAGWAYRLPTEAEWEYACRAGTQTPYSFGEDLGELAAYAWYDANSQKAPHPVGKKRANAWGLFDIHGNVWEWCQTRRMRYPYRADDGREVLTGTSSRILRGGSWARTARYSRSADRSGLVPQFTIYEYGFRVVCAPVEVAPDR